MAVLDALVIEVLMEQPNMMVQNEFTLKIK